jgi:hypothetical protein
MNLSYHWDKCTCMGQTMELDAFSDNHNFLCQMLLDRAHVAPGKIPSCILLGERKG